jgi:hypothetical protein
MLAGRLTERDCERVVLAAYPGLAERASVNGGKSPERWLRNTIEHRGCGLIEDLASAALRLAGVPVEVEGIDRINAAKQQLAQGEAERYWLRQRGELVRAAYPTRHPGLRVCSSSNRSLCVSPPTMCRRRRGRASRPGHVRRRPCSARAPDDPGKADSADEHKPAGRYEVRHRECRRFMPPPILVLPCSRELAG